MLELEKIKKEINWLVNQIKCLLEKKPAATAWSADHTITTGGRYQPGTLVWYDGCVYQAIFENAGIIPTNATYWKNLGAGNLLEETITDWTAAAGTRSFLKNKPTKTSDFTNDGDGTSPYFTVDDFYPDPQIIKTSQLINDGDDGDNPFLDAQNLAVHTEDITVHFTQEEISITESQISDFGEYEIADPTILKDSDIGTTLQPYDSNTTIQGVITLESLGGTTDHTELSNIGTNTHSQIDTHIADETIHFTQAEIFITASQVSDFDIEVENNTAVTLNTAKISATGNELEPSDIDTLAELNAILTDATLIDTNDSRLSDARNPLYHTHVEADITDLDKYTTLEVDTFLLTKEDKTNKVITLSETSTDIEYPSAKLVFDQLSVKQSVNTGFVEGLELSINADPTKFNIAEGYYITTDYTDVLNPIASIKYFPGINGVTPQYLATSNISYVALDINANVVQTSSPFTNTNRRNLTLVGAAIHSNNININVVNEIKAPILGDTNQLHDFIRAIGTLNLFGNIYSPNGANLSLNKSAGEVFGLGINPHNINDPHILVIPEQTALTFRYRLREGTEYADRTTINPTQYDLNGVLTTVSDNKFTIQRINIFQSGITRIQYGQVEYADMASAKLGVQTDPFITEQNIVENAIFRCHLIIKKEVTNLATAITNNTALFVIIDKFGNVVGGVGVALTYAAIIAALGYIPEDEANKQNSLAIDGTGIKYSTVDAVRVHSTSTSNPHSVTKTQVGLGNVDNIQQIPMTYKGTVNGVAELNEFGFVKNEQLPSYVDDVLEYANLAAFPVTGESGKIYIAIDTNKTYRWGGTIYVVISETLTISEVKSDTEIASAISLKHAAVTLGTPNGLSLSVQQLSLALASASITGALSSIDWSTFNSKEPSFSKNTAFNKNFGTIAGTVAEGSHTHLLTSLSGTLAITNGGTGATTAANALTNLGAYPASNPSGYTSNIGTVTSVAMTVPTGLSIGGSPITSSGTLALSLTAGYSIPTTANQTNWNTAYGWGDHSGLYSLLNHTHTFASLTSKPTTLAGYGITDALSTSSSHYIGTTLIANNRASAAQTLTGISIDGNSATATKLASIVTTFSEIYPMVVNAGGVIYSHANVTFEGATGKLTAPIFVGSATLTGVPTAPTATAGNNSTQIATTAFVNTKAGNYLPLAGGTLTGALVGEAALFYGKGTFRNPSPSGASYSNLAVEIYSAGGGPVGIGFHRGGSSQCILSHEDSGLIVRSSTIVTGALASIEASIFKSGVATGTAPLTVASSTVVTNLNADLLDGQHASAFQLALTNPITGSLTTGYIPKATGANSLGNSLIYDNGTNVGIGTFGPVSKLEIEATLSGQNTFPLTLTNLLQDAGTEVSLRFSPTGNKDTRYAAISGINNGGNVIALKFTTGSGSTITEKMRITGDGNVLIGTTTDNTVDKLQVNGSGEFAGSITATSFLGNATTATTLQTARTINGVSFNGSANITIPDTNYYPTTFTWTGGTTAGPTGSLTGVGMSAVSYAAIPSASTSASGIINTTTQSFAGAKTFTSSISSPDFIGTSDIRLKENIALLQYKEIKSIYKTFNFKNDKEQRVGVIAQELELKHPEFVRTNDEGVKSVSYIDLHSAEIAYLKDKVERLEKLINKLIK